MDTDCQSEDNEWISFSNKKPTLHIHPSTKLFCIDELHKSDKILETKASKQHGNHKIALNTVNSQPLSTIGPLLVSPKHSKPLFTKKSSTKLASEKLRLVDDIESTHYKDNLSINKHSSLKNLPTECSSDGLRRESLRVLPSISTKNGINNYLIKSNLKETKPDEIIKSSMNKKTVTEHFFSVENERKKSKVIQISKDFNLHRSPIKYNEYFEKLIKELKNHKQPQPQLHSQPHNESPDIMNSEREYEKVKEKFEKISQQENEEKALIYANLVFKNRKTDDNNENASVRMKILRNNLKNTIFLRKILKTKIALFTEDEEVGLGAIKDMKKNNREIQYYTSKVLKHCSQNFIKNKLKTTTHRRFLSVDGKYFGVVC